MNMNILHALTFAIAVLPAPVIAATLTSFDIALSVGGFTRINDDGVSPSAGPEASWTSGGVSNFLFDMTSETTFQITV
jgi:hypothetical protein